MGDFTEHQRAGAEFLLRLGRALHRYGTPVDQLESALTALARTLDLEAEFLVTPTSLLVAFGRPLEQRASLTRVEPGGVDLDKLDRLDQLTHDVIHGRIDVTAGFERVRLIESRPPRYGGPTVVAAYSLSSAAAARFFGGGFSEIAAACVAGLAIGLLTVITKDRTDGARVYELIGAFAAASIAHLSQYWGLGNSVQLTLFAGVIVLVPGLTLTVAMAEIATRNLVAGTVRAMSAAGALLQILVGSAVAGALASRLLDASPAPAIEGLPWWTEPIALVVAGNVFCVLFAARLRFAPVIIVALATAFYGSRLGASFLGAELGSGAGAFAVTAASNVWSRFTGRSAQIPQVPAILLLVPGSVGLRGVRALLAQDVVGGVNTLFSMVLIAASIAAGMLAANAAFSPRRVI